VSDEDLAHQLAIGRAAIGVALLAAPGLLAGLWLGDDARTAASRSLARALGAREVVLGLGLRRSLSRGESVAAWAGAGVVADAADFAITLTADDLPLVGRGGVLVAAGSGTGIGLRILQRLA
jgi:hypothetical protein